MKVFGAGESGGVMPHPDFVHECSLSSDERLLATALSDETMRLWDVQC